MRSHRLRSLVLGFLLICAPLSGWSAAAPATVKMGLANFQLGASPSLEELVSIFNEQHPDIRVELVGTENHWDKLIVLESLNELPDVFYVDLNAYFPGAVERGALLNLDPFVAKDPVLAADLVPAIREAYSYRGSLYALTTTVGADALYFNRKMFDEAAVAYPDASWTWETLLDSARKLTRRSGDGEPSQFGYLTNAVPQEWHADWWWTWVWRFGGAITDPEETRVTIESPEAEAALRFIHELIWEARVAPNFAERRAGPWEEFVQERAAMIVRFPGYQNTLLKTAEFPWGIAPIPLGPAGRQFMIASAGYAIAAQTEVPEAAWTFLRWLVTDGAVLSNPNQPAAPTLTALHEYVEASPIRDLGLFNLYDPDYLKDGRLLPLALRKEMHSRFLPGQSVMWPFYRNEESPQAALVKMAVVIQNMLTPDP